MSIENESIFSYLRRRWRDFTDYRRFSTREKRAIAREIQIQTKEAEEKSQYELFKYSLIRELDRWFVEVKALYVRVTIFDGQRALFERAFEDESFTAHYIVENFTERSVDIRPRELEYASKD